LAWKTGFQPQEKIAMKKPPSKIRDEIARLQEQLKAAETREAERIGRIALKAGLGEIVIDESELQSAFDELARRFRSLEVGSQEGSAGRANSLGSVDTSTIKAVPVPGRAGEA
jgi:hypothetical protein